MLGETKQNGASSFGTVESGHENSIPDTAGDPQSAHGVPKSTLGLAMGEPVTDSAVILANETTESSPESVFSSCNQSDETHLTSENDESCSADIDIGQHIKSKKKVQARKSTEPHFRSWARGKSPMGPNSKAYETINQWWKNRGLTFRGNDEQEMHTRDH
ncbi:hypothetical protein P152DRAFT_448062 [Eremomyces bilateralis CBS 781.70]|uniref:Uncharacterized protein n=1 Tax=Eremomyces bilateralis CBS 781.70 TaxID=1392243 RepID=A0A6G1G6P4_9PEZI|nr:uncharacterized protein P152DRAFT_448062 [Eremomyces bilateralis CBS 781.70]KAF1813631.1 hypothetical protein P152DRAFT_448062 [Eremomyces bilateralis CBS 781.70]